MSSIKEGDLITAVFLYISRSIAEGDIAALHRMELTAELRQLIGELRLEELQSLAFRLPHSHFLAIRFDCAALEKAARVLISQRRVPTKALVPSGDEARATTKEGDLLTAVFLYLSRSIAEGEVEALCRMQLTPALLRLIGELRLDDMQSLAVTVLHTAVLEVRFAGDAFQRAVRGMIQLRAERALKLELIQRGAPQSMMEALYGMTRNDYASWHVITQAASPAGRPSRPTEEEVQRVWKTLRQLVGDKPLGELTPSDYLNLYQRTGIALRTVWLIVSAWHRNAA
jgi:hypothetical protein